jgi:hypothetical protein
VARLCLKKSDRFDVMMIYFFSVRVAIRVDRHAIGCMTGARFLRHPCRG